tara:strand:- start:37866 stop:38246 length:381 start_codon:yes stop_codon:yes gene_type:complete
MRRVAPFLLVGCCAALVHQLVVIALVESGLLSPQVANVPGFGAAWVVSYLGHRNLTFRSDAPHWQAAPRFLAVSIFSFATNQSLFMALLNFAGVQYIVALLITQVVVAVGTYVLSAVWAFRSADSR